MSHIPERKEKDCLNCGATVQGRYCHICGQENVVPKETFWHMLTHFVYDITHFDSSFFTTVKDLLFKPGFLSREYMLGRRKKYLHPIRMYVFTSAFFFLLFFSIFRVDKAVQTNANQPLTLQEREETIKELKDLLAQDSSNRLLKDGIFILSDTSRPITAKQALTYYTVKNNLINIGNRKYRNQHEYDSVQSSLPAGQRDNWFMRKLMKKINAINEKYRDDPEMGLKKLGDSILHRLPYMLFVSLPLFALLLKLVYTRRKQFYFADHGVFTIHLYIFSFILLLVVFSLSKLQVVTGWGILNWIIALLFLSLFFYLYKGMRVFYGQRRGKTFLKFLLVASFSIVMMLLLFLVFILFSAFTL